MLKTYFLGEAVQIKVFYKAPIVKNIFLFNHNYLLAHVIVIILLSICFKSKLETDTSENYSSRKLGSKGNQMEHCHLLAT